MPFVWPETLPWAQSSSHCHQGLNAGDTGTQSWWLSVLLQPRSPGGADIKVRGGYERKCSRGLDDICARYLVPILAKIPSWEMFALGVHSAEWKKLYLKACIFGISHWKKNLQNTSFLVIINNKIITNVKSWCWLISSTASLFYVLIGIWFENNLAVI